MRRFFDDLFLKPSFLLFVGLFAYIQTIQIRLLYSSTLNIYTFTPEAAVVTLVSVCILYIIMGNQLLRYQVGTKSLGLGDVLKIFGVSLVLFLVVINLISLLVSISFGTFEKNFNKQSLLYDNFLNILNVCIYGGFFLAHFYYQKSRRDREQLSQYHRALAESKIAQLKAQLNPHFLFNNLNVLDQLIEEDKGKASDFLNDFADLYRYLLQTSDSKLVNLEEELAFSLNYFRLMQHRYDEGYQLEVKREENREVFLPPLALQLLLENAFQHNMGSKQAPVCITIAIGRKLTVTNNVIAKPTSKPFGGRGLQNLKEQYALLSAESVDITLIDGAFSVCLPLITYAKP